MHSILSMFVPVIATLLILCPVTTSWYNSTEAFTGHSDVTISLDQKAACNCKDGYCEKGTEVCKCYKGWGLVPKYSSENQYCKKCECRDDYNCTYGTNIWGPVSKKCICPVGYEDKSGICKGTCKRNPCLNGGRCVVKGDDIECQCKEAFTGNLCETCNCKDGFCEKKVCKCHKGWGLFPKSGSESQYCKKCDCRGDYTCTYSKDIWKNQVIKTCICPDGFEDKSGMCKGTCNRNPCLNGGKCVEKGDDIECQCKEPFTGNLCENDKCWIKCGVAHNNIEVDEMCVGNYFGDVICSCRDKTKTFDEREKRCKAQCKDDLNCRNGGKCVKRPNGMFCSCLKGTGGYFCEDIPVCEILQCGTDAECKYDIKEQIAQCQCIDEKLTFDKDDNKCKGQCEDYTCENGGTCIMYKNTPKCLCRSPFSGDKCEIGGRDVNKILEHFIWILCSMIILLALIIACFTVSRCRKDYK